RTKRTRIADDFYTVYEWDHRNRLVSVQEYDDQDALLKQTNHTYDAFNRWIGKQVDDDGDTVFDRSEEFIYDGTQIVLHFEDGATPPSHRYLWGPMVDQLLADEDTSQ